MLLKGVTAVLNWCLTAQPGLLTLHQLYARKQNSYWMTKVADAGGDSKKLWSTLHAVLCKDRSRSRLSTDGLSANDFLNAFSSKVEAVRSSTASAPVKA